MKDRYQDVSSANTVEEPAGRGSTSTEAITQSIGIMYAIRRHLKGHSNCTCCRLILTEGFGLTKIAYHMSPADTNAAVGAADSSEIPSSHQEEPNDHSGQY